MRSWVRGCQAEAEGNATNELFAAGPLRRGITNAQKQLALLLALGGFCVSCSPSDQARNQKPNIVVIMTDDQRADTIQYMPQLDEMSKDGVRFDRAYANSPVCGPSRASFFSGRRASTLGVEDENEGTYDAFDDSETIAVVLQRAGYKTAHIGEYINGYRGGFPSVPPGWDDWFVFSDHFMNLFSPGSIYQDPMVSNNGVVEWLEGHSIDLFTNAAVDFIEANAAEGEFFLSVAYWAPHVPLLVDPRYSGLFAGFEAPKPPSLNETDFSDKPVLLPAVGEEYWPFWIPYLELLSHVDDALGQILEALEEAGIADDTLVIFTSDNGFMFGEHGHLGKGLAYEESARIPLVVRYPNGDAPGVVPDPVAIYDLAPTFADYAEVEFQADGVSLRRAIEGWDLSRTSIFVEMALDDSMNFVAEVWTDFKRVVWAGENTGLVEEYDLKNDPFEMDGGA